LALDLTEEHFIEAKGHTPMLHNELHSVLEKLHGNGKTPRREISQGTEATIPALTAEGDDA